MGTSSWYDEGYWCPNGSGSLESYGLVKWEAGDYEEMLNLIFYASSDFQGGEVHMSSTTYCSEDARGGTVNDNNDAGRSYFVSAYFDVEPPVMQETPAPIITFEEDDSGVHVYVTGEGLNYVEVRVNGEVYDSYDPASGWGGSTSWYIERTYLNPHYIQVTATAQLEGMEPTTVTDEYYQEGYPPLESPTPVIGYKIYDEFVLVWSNFAGDVPEISPENPGDYPDLNDEYFLFMDGEPVNNPYYVDRPSVSEGELVLNFSSYCRVMYGNDSEWAYLTVVVPPIGINFMVDDICYQTIGNNEVSVVINDWAGAYSGQVVIPESVTWEDVTYTVTGVKDWAFAWNGGVTDVTLPATMKAIGERAFSDCNDLATITCHALVPPSVVTDCFISTYDPEHDTYGHATLFVPNESLEAYRNHEEWGRFLQIVPFLGAGPGDINGDGALNVGDVTGIINLIMNAGEDYPAYCDVNGDGDVNINDVTILINRLLNAR